MGFLAWVQIPATGVLADRSWAGAGLGRGSFQAPGQVPVKVFSSVEAQARTGHGPVGRAGDVGSEPVGEIAMIPTRRQLGCDVRQSPAELRESASALFASAAFGPNVKNGLSSGHGSREFQGGN